MQGSIELNYSSSSMRILLSFNELTIKQKNLLIAKTNNGKSLLDLQRLQSNKKNLHMAKINNVKGLLDLQKNSNKIIIKSIKTKMHP